MRGSQVLKSLFLSLVTMTATPIMAEGLQVVLYLPDSLS